MNREKSLIAKIAGWAKHITHIASDAADHAMQAEEPGDGSAGGRKRRSDVRRRAASGTPRGASRAPARKQNSERRWRDAEAPIYR